MEIFLDDNDDDDDEGGHPTIARTSSEINDESES